MKLLVIVLCLLSERYLVHAVSYNRFYWFNGFFDNIIKRTNFSSSAINSYLLLALIVIPILLLTWLILAIFEHLLFGFIGLLINLIIFYYCLGPENPFYPVNTSTDELSNEIVAGNYFAKINNQLFAVILWFIILGPLGVLFYRLLSLCREQEATRSAAKQLVGFLDWVSARITVLLYLLVGNFQQGFNFYSQMFFTSPKNNMILLSTGGLLAARSRAEEPVALPHAQNLVDHALVLLMVALAFFTLVAWL